MRKLKLILIIIIFVLFIFIQLDSPLHANNYSPVGSWKTIDDDTGEVKSIVKLWINEEGILIGKIEKIFPKPDEDPNPVCDKCKGEKRDKPILGMEFMWGFTGADSEWKDGKILDPENGKIYHCQLEVIDNGKKLKVYGYIKIIFKIGRSQTWIREQ